jgi:hypothetical protein
MLDPAAWTSTRSRLARTIRFDPAADTTELRRQFRAERLAFIVCRSLGEDPRLTVEQRREIAALLLSDDHEEASA